MGGSKMINMKDLIKKQTNMIRKESGMKLVTEKKDLDSKHIEKVSKMTDRNNHLGARTHLSYYLINFHHLYQLNQMKHHLI